MKTWTLIIAILCVGRIASAEQALAPYFNGYDVCMIVQNVKTGADEIHFGDKFCTQRLPPCSTFKVPLALMAVEHGLIQNADTAFKWDGLPKRMDEWNSDQTAASWMKNSVVWVSQELTPKLGAPVIQKHLKDFRYGNEDMSGGITKAWLGTTLQISPQEQLNFLRRLWQQQLPISAKATELTKTLMLAETAANGDRLFGKTGSDANNHHRVGWYVGALQKGSNTYVFVLAFKDTQQPLSSEFAGREARKLFREVAKARNLF